MKDTLVTNSSKGELGLYWTADTDLYISEEAYDIHLKRLEGCLSLNCFVKKDLSDFWALFDRLKKTRRMI